MTSKIYNYIAFTTLTVASLTFIVRGNYDSAIILSGIAYVIAQINKKEEN